MSVNSDQQEYQTAVKKLGKRGVLLSRSEFVCFHIARRYQRNVLKREAFGLEHWFWPAALDQLHWSASMPRRLGQGLIIAVSLPFIVSWQLLGRLARLLAFPFRYLRTYMIPRGLAAPGEKTLAGVHNAFARFFDLPPDAYMDCVDEWIQALYGLDRSLRDYIVTMNRGAEQLPAPALSPSMRSYIAVAREKLSQELGHYRA
ncbi:hypothetical protein FKG94_13460 [Exilibacterium tricleocarpae]|uniref:Uncharacterized protein n=1 Tax=Exilibacterium tricleocarpae TaxID=2591008 RepID=A0A545TLI5_9GAMM|nr:hypothetical protein [Exilibacterium tricleocarpae]TQV78083.1 hypothetical protein FKG94_13460 [Exilibacterium tricleocarpae]